MKFKYIIITLVIILLITPVCLGNSNTQIKNIETFPISIFVVKLEENITTPFHWYYKIKDNNIAEVIHHRYIEKEHETGVLGAGGRHIWYVYVKKTGKTEIIFNLKNFNNEIRKTLIYKIKSISTIPN